MTPRARVVGLRVLQFSSVRQLGYSTVSSYCKLYCNWCSDTARHDSARRGCFRCEGSNDHIPPTEFHTVIYTARTRLGETDVVSRQTWTTGYSTAQPVHHCNKKAHHFRNSRSISDVLLSLTRSLLSHPRQDEKQMFDLDLDPGTMRYHRTSNTNTIVLIV